jgi:hypothetical protein
MATTADLRRLTHELTTESNDLKRVMNEDVLARMAQTVAAET